MHIFLLFDNFILIFQHFDFLILLIFLILDILLRFLIKSNAFGR